MKKLLSFFLVIGLVVACNCQNYFLSGKNMPGTTAHTIEKGDAASPSPVEPTGEKAKSSHPIFLYIILAIILFNVIITFFLYRWKKPTYSFEYNTASEPEPELVSTRLFCTQPVLNRRGYSYEEIKEDEDFPGKKNIVFDNRDRLFTC